MLDIFDLDSIRIVKNFSCLAKTNSMLGEILDSFSIIPFKSHEAVWSSLHIPPHQQQQINSRSQRIRAFVGA